MTRPVPPPDPDRARGSVPLQGRSPEDAPTPPPHDPDLLFGLPLDPALDPGLDPRLDPGRDPRGARTRSTTPDPVRASDGRPLDMSQDPDRFDAGAASDPAVALGPLDPFTDPDRFRGTSGPTLTDLLGEGAQEDEREGYTWAFGLLGVVLFLVLVSVAVRVLSAN